MNVLADVHRYFPFSTTLLLANCFNGMPFRYVNCLCGWRARGVSLLAIFVDSFRIFFSTEVNRITMVLLCLYFRAVPICLLPSKMLCAVRWRPPMKLRVRERSTCAKDGYYLFCRKIIMHVPRVCMFQANAVMHMMSVMVYLQNMWTAFSVGI